MKSTRKLRKSSGILSNKPKRIGKVLDKDVQKNVISFYGCDEFPQMCPGKKEYISVKVNSRREHIPKHLLLVNLKELHIEFLKRYNKKIGLSKFCELRPKWCIPVGGASGLQTVCNCEYHQNFKLLSSKIPELSDYKDLVKRIVYNTKNRSCMLRGCDQCPTMDSLRTY